MGEGHIPNFVRSVQTRVILYIASLGILFAALQLSLNAFTPLNDLLISIVLGVLWLSLAIIIGLKLGRSITKPTEHIAQAILHVSPGEQMVAAPNLEDLKFGREMADSLTRQMYSFASVAQQNTPKAETVPSILFDQLPVAVIGLAEDNKIAIANAKANATVKLEKIAGQQFNDTLRLLTEDENSLEKWLQDARQNKVTDFKKWQKVELKNINNESLGYFDVAASFNKHSSTGVETIIALYDHSEVYNEEESSVSFVSMAVHEMRTPLTIMRGYIEAFEDELGTKATPQLADDLQKMNLSADILSSFVSNILNVAKINEGQLALNLQKGNWNEVLPTIVDGLRVKASAYGKDIELRMQPGLPEAAIDRMTISEVITNFIDNSIKYSPDNNDKIMVVSKLNASNQIETTVTDHGVGITESVMPHLFTKFYRNHRTSQKVGGTGLGLFLCKAIINAHQGNIWANSKEGQGSTFGFTLIPYDQLAKDQQSDNNEGIVHSKHGWIKNHTMQRR